MLKCAGIMCQGQVFMHCSHKANGIDMPGDGSMPVIIFHESLWYHCDEVLTQHFYLLI